MSTRPPSSTPSSPASPSTPPAPPGRPGPSAEPASSTVAAARSRELERAITANPGRFRVVTGDRPTGALHLGHYVGTLANRVRLQRAGVEVIVVVADQQVVTDRDGVDAIGAHVRDLVLDQLAAGLTTDGSASSATAPATVFAHSAVPALNQLLVPFLSLVTVAELERNPTVRAEAEAAAARQGRGPSGLLLTYPVHQAADILFARANLVPVGRDQLPHLEVARTIARRFEERYGRGRRVFPEPEALLSATPVLLGLDGTKMSKSRGNAVELQADEDETARLLRRAVTDAERTITYDPVHRPGVATLLQLAALFGSGEEGVTAAPDVVTARAVAIADSLGARGSGALKALATEAVNEHLRPLRARRAELARDPGHLATVLREGARRAAALAGATLDEVRAAMGMTY